MQQEEYFPSKVGTVIPTEGYPSLLLSSVIMHKYLLIVKTGEQAQRRIYEGFVLFVHAVLRAAIHGFLIYVACCTRNVSCFFFLFLGLVK
jgi:hypothetical protein